MHSRIMRFAVPGNDPRIHALVVGLDRGDASAAQTWREVGEAARQLGLRQPCYDTVRQLVRIERLRRKARTATRAAALDVALSLGSSRVVDLPIALDALALAKAKERLVTDRHEPA